MEYFQHESVFEGLLGDLNLSESLTETDQNESLDRCEFANQLANQHSALGSLSLAQTGMKPDPLEKDPKVQTGTLEGLEGNREQSDKGQNSIESGDPKNDQSKSEGQVISKHHARLRRFRASSQAEAARVEGNELFKNGKFREAIKSYDEGIKRCPDVDKVNKFLAYFLSSENCFFRVSV